MNMSHIDEKYNTDITYRYYAVRVGDAVSVLFKAEHNKNGGYYFYFRDKDGKTLKNGYDIDMVELTQTEYTTYQGFGMPVCTDVHTLVGNYDEGVQSVYEYLLFVRVTLP